MRVTPSCFSFVLDNAVEMYTGERVGYTCDRGLEVASHICMSAREMRPVSVKVPVTDLG